MRTSFFTPNLKAILSPRFQHNSKMRFGCVFQSGGLFRNRIAALATFPDGIAIRWETFDSGRFQIVKEDGTYPEMQGSPDWVLEVVSDQSASKDKVALRKAYHAAGVHEYWLVDARGDSVDFTVLTWTESGYVAAETRTMAGR